MMRQTFKFNRTISITIVVLLAVVGLTIRQSLSATPIQNSATKANVALAVDDFGRKNAPVAKPVETFEERAAVVLLYEYNPWAMVIGSDSPSFALYDDGLLIFTRTNQEGRPEYASLTLSEKELNEFLASLPVKEFNELRHEYELDLKTDQPTTVLSIGNKTGFKSVRVYGNLQRSMRADDPQAFMLIYRKLKSFEDARAARWMPEKIELMIWPYENAGDPLAWPKGWPDTAHPTTKKKGTSKDSINYSIYLTQSQYESLLKRVEKESADALLIN
ncbi:MAG: hypothetical protein ICV68_09265, partial [Pyrinomonadaceae bacterium]|nr:hypothetical protein [Pyrinomonadaceae bacterium]